MSLSPGMSWAQVLGSLPLLSAAWKGLGRPASGKHGYIRPLGGSCTFSFCLSRDMSADAPGRRGGPKHRARGRGRNGGKRPLAPGTAISPAGERSELTPKTQGQGPALGAQDTRGEGNPEEGTESEGPLS